MNDLIIRSRKIVGLAYECFERLALAWTGGKDSTLLLWLVRNFAQENGLELPKLMFIDEGQVFPEIWEFIQRMAGEWGLNYNVTCNEDVRGQVKNIGEAVFVKNLNKRNQRELERLGFEDGSFPFEPESVVGNHLMKTVAMNMWLEDNDIQALMTGIRWDEQGARADEIYFSKRDDPPHYRVHPLLHFSEAQIWQTTLAYKIPFVELYQQGYRSLGASGTTTKMSDVPAWEQDFEATAERGGRRQDKENVMQRLRQLGYM